MTRTAVRQEEQVQPSELYDDTVTPSLANYETNTAHAENDFNNVRSQLYNLMKAQTGGNWYDDLATPTTFTGEGEAQRGVDNLNQDLHDIERKRILRRRPVVGADITVPAAVAATEVLTLTANAGNTETVTIDTKTYTFQTVLTNVDGNVLIGATASDSIDNLIAAITLGAGAGTLYAALTTLHPTATASAGAGDTMDAAAKKEGTAGNTIATTETMANGSWGAATMSGGTGDMVILGAGDLPGNTTAAIGAVTTRGTVAANNATFGTATLDEVAGGNNLQPKNLTKIVSASTGDPILTVADGKEIYALFHTESSTDGSTITATTPNRAQLSFVVRNDTNDDLELVKGSDIGGQTIDYAPIERYAFDDIPEEAWLGDDFVDVGVASTTRQATYDNQGTTPVDLTTNAFLDLEGAGLAWRIRDDAQANLFSIIEGSVGSTSEVELGSDVDVFDNDSQDNDFANQLKVATGSTPIHIGVTAGHVETTGSDDLHLQAADEMFLDDGNQVGSTWAQTDGIKLSETTQEWDDFETEFGGEVSLLNAIVAAAQSGVTRCKAVAEVDTANISANTLIEGPNGPGTQNISADLCDYRNLTFVSDVDVFINGLLQRNGANSSADHDVYPSAVTAERQYGCFYAEYDLKYRGGTRPDVITMLAWGDPVPP